ncbi:hypothetical protein [Urbifossiella limnaea]|uniref:Tetratricopeptide repeat protein n=1 Tax=Urbifossiella limnaea TaxID=2528023 RepID=A0A517XZP4_9BACT|nr:hypothetical protein [Urbifossiella limnaea]QDU22981.1 hypothetical protein ETAA1_49710 [Urbifossiella limnaea]
MSNSTDPRPEDLPPLPVPPPDPADDVPMALGDLDEAAEAVPAADLVEDAVAYDLPENPAAHPGERTLGVEYLSEADATGLPPIPPVSPAESWLTAGAEPEEIPDAASASSSALFDEPAPFASAAESGEIVDLAGPSPSASSLFGESVPEAGPASGFIATAEAVGDSAVNVDPTVEPVAPASGWFSRDDIPAVQVVTDGIEAELAGPLPPSAHGHGSDVFASPPPPRALGDLSDVIAATSWAGPASPASPAGRGTDRTSDVALTFDQPPGGSTVQEPADDLPVADDVPDGGSLFGDSATLARTPPLPDDGAVDFSAADPRGTDASSILADLSEPAGPLTDGSAVRIEAPGIDPTLAEDDLPAAFAAPDSTAGRARLWDDGQDDVDFDSDPSNSDLFQEPRAAGPRFELTPDAGGASDLFAGVEDGEEPSLSSAQSSIFTTPTAPLTGGSGAVRVEGDAVEFSDHPDPAASGVDFDLAGGPSSPERTLHRAFPDDDELDLTDPDGARSPQPSTGDVLAASRDEGAGSDWMTAIEPAAPASGSSPKKAGPGFVAEPAAPVRAVRPGTSQSGTSGSVELDWVAGSSTSELLLTETPVKPARRAAARGADDTSGETRVLPAASDGGGGGVNRGAGVGLLFGLLLGGGIASGVYFSGVLDQGKTGGPVAVLPPIKGTDTNQAPVPGTAPPATPADARAALDSGDPARALKLLEAAGVSTPEAKASRGQARLLARLRDASAVTADDAALKDARADLEAAMADADEKTAVRAAVHLGLTHEVAGDRGKAKQVYTTAAAKFPKAADVFKAAVDRLDATAPPAAPGGATSLRLNPADAERFVLAAAFLFLQDEPAAEPAEAGGQFWRAVNLAAGGKYADAITAIDAAKKAHAERARALAGRGLNPLTDPLEQIFPRSCDDLKAYWQLRRTIYEHPTVGALARAEGAGKALDTFAGYRTERDTAVSDAKLANEKLVAAQKGLLAEQEALKSEKAALKTEKELSAKYGDDLKKAAADLTKAKTDAVALMKDAVAAMKLADDTAAKARTLEGELAAAAKGRKDAEAVVAGVAAELRAAKLLPEKYAPPEVIAAAKSAASRATGPDLTSLIPPGSTAAVGGPATTGTLVDLAARAGKLDAAAKKAAADLLTATKKHESDYAAARTAADAALKKATDDAAKLLDTTRTEAEKLLTKTKTEAVTELTRTKADAEKLLTKTKADAAADVAKAKTDAAGMLTKLKTDSDATLAKLKTDHKAETAALEKKLADDAAAAKAALLVAERQFRAELANAVSPSEALPLWQAVLTDLRRPSDADPALAAADRVLKSAVPDSEAAARANVVSGLALALKGDTAAARDRFERAKRSPAYAATKDWGRAADTGLAALTDPAAPSRVAVDTTRRRDAAEAARSLGAGIAAYNAGNVAAAERALADAAWHDPDSPLPWYFLGATRYAAGKVEQARDDFRQGAVREAKGAVPSRVIGTAIAPIQGPARAALDAVRP